MQVNLSVELMVEVTDHIKKHENGRSLESLIEDAVAGYLNSWPWFSGDICTHNEECMHWKSVEEWMEEDE